MRNFEEYHFSDYIKYIDQVISEFERRFSDFKKLESDVSLFTQTLAIATETVKTGYHLELCYLKSDPFYKSRTKPILTF